MKDVREKTTYETIIDKLDPDGEELFILIDPEVKEGLLWKENHRGHPEANVLAHVKAVFDNIDRWYKNDTDYRQLRIIALLHDTYKYLVNKNLPKTADNIHSRIAYQKAQKFTKDERVLSVIKLHDDAFYAYCFGRESGWHDGGTLMCENILDRLIAQLEETDSLDLFLKFFRCDNEVEGKKGVAVISALLTKRIAIHRRNK